jgi:hypothetical protein
MTPSVTPAFRFGHARGEDWQEAARQCLAQLGGPPASLGFLYVTDLLADDLNDILDFFRQRTGVAHWVGHRRHRNLRERARISRPARHGGDAGRVLG